MGSPIPASLTPRTPSQSAILTAAARALHREEAPPWILDDTLALRLAGDAGTAVLERARANLSHDELFGFSRWVCARARVGEDLVERLVPSGLHQYVILGAGLDSFAYRRPDLVERVRVFEVDHPASQSWKRTRLDESGISVPPNLMFAPVDFERQTLRDGLAEAGFDFSALAVFGWIGVTMYLSRPAISETLRSVAGCAAGSRLVMTYNVPLPEVSDYSRRVTSGLQLVTAEGGEPFISFFLPDEIERLVADHGFTGIEHFGADEARRAYLGGRDVPIAGAQRVLLATVT